jgi:hypothetical protein
MFNETNLLLNFRNLNEADKLRSLDTWLEKGDYIFYKKLSDMSDFLSNSQEYQDLI